MPSCNRTESSELKNITSPELSQNLDTKDLNLQSKAEKNDKNEKENHMKLRKKNLIKF